MYIYVAGPISTGANGSRRKMKKRVDKAIGIGITLLQRGFVPYIPHLDHSMGAHPRGKLLTWDDFLNWDLSWIRKCDAIYRIKGKSTGADIECRFMKRLGKPIFTSMKELEKYNKSRGKKNGNSKRK